MPNQIVRVPQLGGTDAAYQISQPYDPAKPTIVLINSFTTTSELFQAQFSDSRLTDIANLLAIEPLGHGQTRARRESWTYWDSAEMNFQVMDALRISKVFVLGTSQGGSIAARMAVLRPEKIIGLIPIGTSLDSESERSRQLGCWDAPGVLQSIIMRWTVKNPTPDFEPDTKYCDFLIDTGFNDCSLQTREFWRNSIKANYQGDAGRKRIRMAAINLAEHDGLHLRLPEVGCPVLWMQGNQDAVYSVENASQEIQLFVNSPDAQLVVVDGGAHLLNATHPGEVNGALVDFVKRQGL
ncbi:hypothetical protein MPDQ_001443 [Monascus purpureus]|uniref:AB hydrolase-1 domain-containing protein n=1 Tax=Monascus purpureus TaxID=5098 RepID=A0A507R4H6_MONPU|nr:hypothetical protein MPDQ_001443 [Monascus purpureus]BDD61654.1 hypothetical protein MAP00_006692 [Monascus purpureus]